MAAMKRYGIMISAVGVVILGALTVSWAGGGRGGASSLAAPAVPLPLQGAVRAEGHVVSYPGATVDVRSEIAGRIIRLSVQELQRVRRGDIIAEITADEERAALAEAEARSVEAAADTVWLTSELQRTTPLVQTGGISQQAIDRTAHDLAAARARHALAEAAVRRLRAMLAKTYIVAPIDGTITARVAESGEVVGPGTRLVTITDLSRRRVEAEVDEYDAGRVRPGASVTITAEGYEKQVWRGAVEVVPDVVVPRKLRPQDPGRPSDTRVLLVKASLPQDAPLKLGQRVELAFESR